MVRIPYQRASFEDGKLHGTIPVLDPQFGNVWTNIDRKTFAALGVPEGGVLEATILHGSRQVYSGRMPLARTFGDVPRGKPLAYFNSQGRLSFAINMGSFARTHGVGSGAKWRVVVVRRR